MPLTPREARKKSFLFLFSPIRPSLPKGSQSHDEHNQAKVFFLCIMRPALHVSSARRNAIIFFNLPAHKFVHCTNEGMKKGEPKASEREKTSAE